MISEQKLVTQLLEGDTRAEEAFDLAYRPRLLRASAYILGGHDSDAEDIVQETLLIARAKLPCYDFRAPIFAWLKQICLRLCYARLRKRSRVVVSVEADLDLFMRRISAERLQDEDSEHVKIARLALLESLKEKLGSVSRQIVEMRDLKGISYLEISKILKIPIGTVMSRLSRGRQKLRTLVKLNAAQNSEEKPILTPGKRFSAPQTRSVRRTSL